MEIERKFLIENLPSDLAGYKCLLIEQAYLCTCPVIRIRREDDNYYLTYKGKGLMAREEYNLPLNKEAYEHMLVKADGNIISKRRYLIPVTKPIFAKGYTLSDCSVKLTIELDIFLDSLAPLVLAEVEFSSEEEANSFVPPAWFGEDVTFSGKYHNSYLSCLKF